MHHRIHSGERPYICFCGKEFTRQDKCKRHLATHPPEEVLQNQSKIIAPRHDCMLSDVFKSVDDGFICSINQKPQLVKTKMPCPQCGETFYNEKLFESHLKIHAVSRSLKDNFKCPCGREFRSLKWLSNHQIREKCPEAEEELEQKARKRLAAFPSSAEYSGTMAVLPNLNDENGSAVDADGAASEKAELESYLTSKIEIGPVSSSAKKLHPNDLHLDNWQQFYDQLVAGTPLMSESSLLPSLTNNSVLECSTKSDGERNSFKCHSCHKTFVTKSKLVIHERTHTGEKPYDCIFCGKRFARKDHLHKHMKTHKKFQDMSESTKFALTLDMSHNEAVGQSHIAEFSPSKKSVCGVTESKSFNLASFIASLQSNNADSQVDELDGSGSNHLSENDGKIEDYTLSCASVDSSSECKADNNLDVNEFLNLLSNDEKEGDDELREMLMCPICSQSVLTIEFKTHFFSHCQSNNSGFADIL